MLYFIVGCVCFALGVFIRPIYDFVYGLYVQYGKNE